jgi:hypothetical protein
MPELIDAETAAFLRRTRHWLVNGKRDGYKLKKLTVGRSIQAASVELKALWLALFHDNQSCWESRNIWFRVGADPNAAVPPHLAWIYKEAEAVVSYDATAWDRYMPTTLIHHAIEVLGKTAPGLNDSVKRHLEETIASGVLWFTDGDRFIKRRGNPSGHPMTLRLNCSVNLIVWLYVLLKAETIFDPVDLSWRPYSVPELREMLLNFEIFPEFCGDDVRLIVRRTPQTEPLIRCMCVAHKTEGGVDALHLALSDFPWEQKLEGFWTRNERVPLEQDLLGFPSFVSRNLVCYKGFLWTIPANTSRTVRKLMFDTDRTPEQEQELVEIFNIQLAWVDWLDFAGLFHDPAIRELRRHPLWKASVTMNTVGQYMKHAFFRAPDPD